MHDPFFSQNFYYVLVMTLRCTPDDGIETPKDMVIPIKEKDISTARLIDVVYPNLVSNSSNL